MSKLERGAAKNKKNVSTSESASHLRAKDLEKRQSVHDFKRSKVIRGSLARRKAVATQVEKKRPKLDTFGGKTDLVAGEDVKWPLKVYEGINKAEKIANILGIK
ncbi:hypothetical protein KKG71_05685, partial [Patescibacteria group bacterium]|nr:hypothetical protein [Patescibacteria group bacterium]